MEDDVQRLQLLQPLVERLFRLVGVVVQRREVGAPEVARVGQPRPHDAPIARRDRRAAVAGDEVGDENELVGEARPALPSTSWPGLTRPSTSLLRRAGRAAWMAGSSPAMTGRSGVAQHEALLVGADGGADHFGRNVEERAVELAHQHDRPFDQPGDFVEQPLVLDQFEAVGERQALRVGEDDLPCAGRGRARPWPWRARRRNRRSGAHELPPARGSDGRR